MADRRPQKVWRRKRTLPTLPSELLGKITENAPQLQPLTRQTNKYYQELYPLQWTSILEAYEAVSALLTKNPQEVIDIIDRSPGFLPKLADIPRIRTYWESFISPYQRSSTLLDELYKQAYMHSPIEVVTTILSKSHWKVDSKLVISLMGVHSWTVNIQIVDYILKYGPDNYYWELYHITQNLPSSLLRDLRQESIINMDESGNEIPLSGDVELLARLTVLIMNKLLKTHHLDRDDLLRWEKYLENNLRSWDDIKNIMIETISIYITDPEIPKYIDEVIEPFHQLMQDSLILIRRQINSGKKL